MIAAFAVIQLCQKKKRSIIVQGKLDSASASAVMATAVGFIVYAFGLDHEFVGGLSLDGTHPVTFEGH